MPDGLTSARDDNDDKDGHMTELLRMQCLLARRLDDIRAQRMKQLQLTQSNGSGIPAMSYMGDPHIMVFQHLRPNTGSEVIFNMPTFPPHYIELSGDAETLTANNDMLIEIDKYELA